MGRPKTKPYRVTFVSAQYWETDIFGKTTLEHVFSHEFYPKYKDTRKSEEIAEVYLEALSQSLMINGTTRVLKVKKHTYVQVPK